MAVIQLAEKYEKGNGVDKDYAEALRLIKQLADRGSPLGQAALADYYAKGIVVPKDDAEAFKYFLLASNQGYSIAYAMVGESYALGRGVQKNEADAIKWFRKCNDEVTDKLCHFARTLATGNGVPKDVEAAIKWFTIAITEAHNQSQLHGVVYDVTYGSSFQGNLNAVFKLCKMAALRGSGMAQNKVGEMYASGEGVPKDEVESLAWFYVGVATDSDTVSKIHRDSMEQRLGRAMTLIA